jgi:sugar lactone lactonase YvrE
MKLDSVCHVRVWGLLVGVTSGWGQQHMISTVVGGPSIPTPVAAVKASFKGRFLTVDTRGDVYFSATVGTNRHATDVYKIDLAGTLTRVAGNGSEGYSGDGGPAVRAQLSVAAGLAMDSAGNLYIADSNNHRMRMVDPAGIITTIAGADDGDAG